MPPAQVTAPKRLWLFRSTAAAGSATIAAVAAIGLWNLYAYFGPTPAERTAAAFDSSWASLPDLTQSLFESGGYGPRERLVAPANFDGALVFSGTVMQGHPQRGYCFRPAQQNLWVYPRGIPHQILVPDTQAIRKVLQQSGTAITATERINSLGCRGPEPGDPLDYDFRLLVLGDSFAEGILVDEDSTFSARLQKLLVDSTGMNTLVVNSGVIGYSTEQEFRTLEELSPKVRPHVAILCFYANDVHRDHVAVLSGRTAAGDWDAARLWLDRSVYFCRANQIYFVVAVIPDRSQMARRASRRQYQQRLETIAADLGIYLIDPDERFLANHREPLWLQGDAHFSRAGHAVFAEALADHVRHWAPKGPAR
jgi:lysophospholipase L1-like esterase